MLPGNIDPRRPDKVQRYKPPTTNGNGQGEDLTPDYMNILGQRATTANATTEIVGDKLVDGAAVIVNIEPNLQVQRGEDNNIIQPIIEDVVIGTDYSVNTATATNNVIPTSPQYGVAIISSSSSSTSSSTTTTASNNIVTDLPTTEVVTISTDTVTDTITKPNILSSDDNNSTSNKDLHSTPSKNDRFKVVKIASLEPFKRGRWKCMDYLDEVPNPATINQQSKVVAQSAGSIPVVAGGVYLQTQSLPQQQIQQMLIQSGYSNGTQFFNNQMIPPQAQYFYPPGANIQTQTLPQQLVNTTGVPSSMPAQFINTSQPYFTGGGVVQNSAGGFTVQPNYQNVQYVPQNVIQNQGSAFVPTSQTVQLPTNFQQSQTYAGQPNVSQSNVPQPMVNGHAYPQQNEQQQVTSSSLPTQTAKNIILNSNVQQPVVSQSQISQQIPVQNSTPSQSVPVIQNQQQYQQQQNTNFQQQIPNQTQNTQNMNQTQPVIQVVSVPSQTFDQNQTNNVYTNQQFDGNSNVNNSVIILENSENSSSDTINNDSSGGEITTSESITTDDPSKTNPVVNAIDNKIEQAMDLVKSHLMYTVREEVEVLKEKIAELMERIQQLETENNFLRSQIPKNTNIINPTTSNNNSTSNVSSSVTTTQNVVALTSNPTTNTVTTNSNNTGTINETSQQ